MKKIICGVLAIAALAGCAGYRPIIDPKGVDMNAYDRDVKECQDVSKQVNAGGEAAGAAVAGAVFGALLGAAVGGRSFAGAGAGVGAVSAGGAGAAHGLAGQMQVVRNCMAGRGYRVLR